MINLDDVDEGIKELERTAKMGLVGGMITEYPAEDRRYFGEEYEPFWAAAQDLNMPLSLHHRDHQRGPQQGAWQYHPSATPAAGPTRYSGPPPHCAT